MLRAGLIDVQFESGSQQRMDAGWKWIDFPNDPLSSYWQENESWTPGRTWALSAGVFLNDNFRLGMRWQTVTTHGSTPAPFDSAVISLDASAFSNPQGPFSASISLRAGLAPGFPTRNPSDYYPLYGIRMPARVYGAALGVRWIASPHVAIDADLVSTELWAFGSIDVWHFSWLTPRVSVLF